MIGLVIAGMSFAYLAVGLAFARRAYRTTAARLKDTREPAVYGHGWMTEADKRRKALDKALITYAGWPFVMMAAMFEWLVTTEHLLGVPDSETDPWLWPDPDKFTVIDARPDRDGTDELIEKLDHEINGMRVTRKETDPWLWDDRIEVTLDKPGDEREDYLALKHGPRNTPCPCGYITECVIHCGDGAECHRRGHPESQ